MVFSHQSHLNRNLKLARRQDLLTTIFAFSFSLLGSETFFNIFVIFVLYSVSSLSVSHIFVVVSARRLGGTVMRTSSLLLRYLLYLPTCLSSQNFVLPLHFALITVSEAPKTPEWIRAKAGTEYIAQSHERHVDYVVGIKRLTLFHTSHTA